MFLVTSATAEHKKLQQVSIQLEWKHQFEFAGFYAALDQGYYKDFGLNVEIKEYNSSIDVTNDVLNGVSTYGISSSHLIIERLSGKKIIQLASYLKQNALVLITKPDIKTIEDLKNKKVMALTNELKNTSLAAMLKEHNLDINDIDIIPHSFNIDAFVNNDIDAMTVFLSNQLFLLDKKQIPYKIFNPSTDGIYSYDVELFTSENEVKNYPLRTQNFIDATQKGWKYALLHKEEIVELIYKKYSKKKSKEALLYEANSIDKLMKTDLFKIGVVVPELIQLNTNMYVQLGMVDKNWNLKNFIFHTKLRKINLTPAELAFIKTHSKIVLGTEKAWKPYVIVAEDGTVSGYDADVLRLINEVSGSNFTLEAGNWDEMQDKAKLKKIDGLSTGSIQDERKDYLNFSDIYISMRKMLIVSKENPKNIHTLNDLDGKIIAIHKSNLVDENIAHKFLNSKILRLDTIEEVITYVTTGKADAMFGNGATFYLANELGLPYLKRVAKLNDTLELAFGVRKDWSEAVSIINKSLDYIGEYKLLELKNKWFWQDKATLLDRSYKKLILTDKERKYLQNKKQIKICIDPDWMPFEKIEEGKHIGISAAYLQLISAKIGIPFALVPTKTWNNSIEFAKKRKCDIFSLAMKTTKRKKYMNFTKPYITAPLVVATTNDKFFISKIKDLQGKSIGIGRNYAQKELLENKYPMINFIEVSNLKKGLEEVIKGSLFGYIDSLITMTYQIQKYFPTELKIAGQFNENLILGIGVRNDEPILLDIINKAINIIDNRVKDKIFNQWISVKYEQGTDYKLLWYILIPFFILALILLISQYILRGYNKKLENQVKEKIEELRQKDEILLQKHRMATMGEMISMIAHQWKQPLGAISFILISIKTKLESGFFNLDDKDDRKKFLTYLEQKHESINLYIKHLSTTTDDFRNLFNPNKSKERVPLTVPIENALSIVQNQMQNRNIEIVKDYQEDIEFYLYKNEVMQVILNILKNAEDNFLIKNISNPKIIIKTQKIKSNLIISICDNGRGIPENIINKIFDPYFSTKNETNGTGLGLYMSKTIIEKHNDGILNIKNTKEGACFEIIFNLE